MDMVERVVRAIFPTRFEEYSSRHGPPSLYEHLQKDGLARARAAIEAVGDGWMPIETAPKDGTRILLWIEPTCIAMPFEWENDRWMGDDFPLNMAWPTHWRPLPDPPEQREGASR